MILKGLRSENTAIALWMMGFFIAGMAVTALAVGVLLGIVFGIGYLIYQFLPNWAFMAYLIFIMVAWIYWIFMLLVKLGRMAG